MALKVNWAIPIEPESLRRSFSPIDPTPYPHRSRRHGPPECSGSNYPAHAIRRAREAILRVVDRLDLTDPMLPAAIRFATANGRPHLTAPLLAAWKVRSAGGADRERRFPWALGRDALPGSPVCESVDGRGALWRPRERDWLEREPTSFAHRLIAPVAIAENLDFLATLTTDPNTELARTAGEILRDVQSLVEGDVADYIRGEDPWRDTFALWQLARRPRALELLHPLGLGIATRFGTLASRLAGLPCGSRYPFEAVPLVSASAHLGLGLWTLAYRPSLLPGLIAFVGSREHPTGGWGDDGQDPDILTTLAAAEFLGSLDPTFDSTRTVEYFVRNQEPDGWWRALDPEVPWLTAAIADWLSTADRPFHERFRWPSYQRTELDRKTGIPTFAAFDGLVRVFGALPGLANARVAVAFADLAGFRAFNNACGQDVGDAALRLFAQHLRSIDGGLAIRDGGDEFILVGAPTRPFLADEIDAARATWPARFQARFGTEVPVVAPRFVVGAGTGSQLSQIRERLGREIALRKGDALEPDGRGTLSTITI